MVVLVLFCEVKYFLLRLMLTMEGRWFFIFRFSKSILFFVNWIWLYFFITYKIWPFMFSNIAFWLGCDRPSRLLTSLPALLLSILMPLIIHSSFVSLSYLFLAVPMPECLGKHLCMSSPFPIAILNDVFFREMTWSFRSKSRVSKTNYYK